MSYILDALRKSEQERQRGKVPDIHGGVSDSTEARTKTNFWPMITIAVIVLNLGILGYFWFSIPANEVADQATIQATAPSPSPTNPSSTTSPTIQSPTAAAPKQQPIKPQSSSSVAAYSPPEMSSPVRPAVTNAPPQSETDFGASERAESEQPLPKVGYMPQLEELPAYERDGIPDMTFSSHMYSSMPRFRSIIINGKRLKEGQYLNEDLQVREITESGVIMSFGNTLFEVDVLGRWAQ